MRQSLKFAALFLVTSALCSCASASLVETWRNPGLRVARLQKVLVVSITRKDASRLIYEDMIANELSKRGVEAIASHTILPAGERAEWAVLERTVKKAAAQAVLTVQTIKIEQQTTVQPGYTAYPGWYPSAFPTWDLYGYYGAMAHYGPSYISTYDVATMQVNLFDAASGKLIWAATVESSEPERVISVGKDLSRIIVDSLVKNGLI